MSRNHYFTEQPSFNAALNVFECKGNATMRRVCERDNFKKMDYFDEIFWVDRFRKKEDAINFWERSG